MTGRVGSDERACSDRIGIAERYRRIPRIGVVGVASREDRTLVTEDEQRIAVVEDDRTGTRCVLSGIDLDGRLP